MYPRSTAATSLGCTLNLPFSALSLKSACLRALAFRRTISFFSCSLRAASASVLASELPLPAVVIAALHRNGGAVERKRMRDAAVQKAAVMAHQQKAALAGQVLAPPFRGPADPDGWWVRRSAGSRPPGRRAPRAAALVCSPRLSVSNGRESSSVVKAQQIGFRLQPPFGLIRRKA